MLFGPILESAPAMQRNLIAKELNIAFLELDIGCEFGDRVAIELNRLFLLGGQRRHAGNPQHLLDRRAGANGAEVPVGETVDRLLVPGRGPGRHLTIVRAIEIPGQHLYQIRPPIEHLVVKRDRAGNAASAALLGRMQAKQSGTIAGIRVEANLRIRVVAAARGAVIFADVLHMPKHVPVPVLHHLVAEIGAKPHIGDRNTFAVQPINWKILHHHEAAPIDQFSANIGENVLQPSKRKVIAIDVRERQPALAECFHRGKQLILIPFGDSIGPILDRPQSLGKPTCRVDDGLHRDRRYAPRPVVRAKIRHCAPPLRANQVRMFGLTSKYRSGRPLQHHGEADGCDQAHYGLIARLVRSTIALGVAYIRCTSSCTWSPDCGLIDSCRRSASRKNSGSLMTASNAVRNTLTCSGGVAGGATKKRMNTCWLATSSTTLRSSSVFRNCQISGTPIAVSSGSGLSPT